MKKPLVGLICNKQTQNFYFLGDIDLSYVMQDYLDIIEKFDGLLFAGSADIAPSIYGEDAKIGLDKVFEEADEAQVYLARLAQKMNTPVLGTCKGCQIINVAFGGSLYQDIPLVIKGANLHDVGERCNVALI